MFWKDVSERKKYSKILNYDRRVTMWLHLSQKARMEWILSCTSMYCLLLFIFHVMRHFTLSGSQSTCSSQHALLVIYTKMKNGQFESSLRKTRYLGNLKNFRTGCYIVTRCTNLVSVHYFLPLGI